MAGGIILGDAFSGGVTSYLCHTLGGCRVGRIYFVDNRGGGGSDGDGGGALGGSKEASEGEVAGGRQYAPRFEGPR